MAKGRLFEYAVLFHPKRKKDEVEAGTHPRSQIIVAPTVVVGTDLEIPMIAARAIPETYQDKLEDVEIVVRPF